MGTQEAPQDLRAWLESVEPQVEVETFGEGDAAFAVEFRRVDKRQLEELYKRCVRTVRDRRGNESKDHDVSKFRTGLRDLALVGWQGLTYAKVALATGRSTATLNGLGNTTIAYSPEHAMVLMEFARGVVDGMPMSFEDFVFDRATKLADRAAREERQAGEG